MRQKRTFATIIVLLLIFTVGASSPNDRFTLVIDAGHGGHDAGAIGTYSKEKNINLNVALAFGKLVEKNCNDVTVIYTRKADVFIPLQERAEIANKNKADLFVSIHTNALPNGRIAYGSETYTLGMARSSENFDVAKRENSVILVENDYKEKYAGFNPNSSESYIIFEFMQDEHMKQSINLAKSIQKYYVSMAGRKNKGVHQAGFLVLRETSMPSVLTELGFITTPEEEAYLNSQDGVNKLARSIFEGFLDYKQSQDGKIRPTVSYPQENTAISNNNATGTVTAARQTDTVATKNNPSVLAQVINNKQTESKTQTDEKEKRNTVLPARNETTTGEKPVFKIQFMTSDAPLKSNDKQLQGYSDVEYYQEKKGGMVKYTCMPTTDYNQAVKNQKEIRKKNPAAFMVAFKNGKRIGLAEAVAEFRSNKQ